MLVNSSIRDLDSKGMGLSAKASAARTQEGGRHAVRKFRRAIKVKITIEDRKRGNLAVEFKREKIVSERRRTDKTKSLRLYSVQESCVRGAPPHICDVYSIRGRARLMYMDINCAGEKNWRRQYRTPSFEEADLVKEMSSFQLRFRVKDRPRMFIVEEGDSCVLSKNRG